MKTITGISKKVSRKMTLAEAKAFNKQFNALLTPSEDYIVYEVNPFDLKYIGFNRGETLEEKQTIRKRVDNIKNLIRANKFIWALSLLTGFERWKNGILEIVLFDGHNRTQAVRELIKEEVLPADYKVPMILVNTPEILAMNDEQIAELVSIINDYNPRWTENEHIKTALHFKSRTAKLLQHYKSKMSNAIEGDLKIAYNWLYSLGSNNSNFTIKNQKMTFTLLKDNSVADNMCKAEFEQKFNTFVNIVQKYVMKWEKKGIRPSKAISYVLYYGMNDFDRVEKVLSRKSMPENEKALRKFFGNAFAL